MQHRASWLFAVVVACTTGAEARALIVGAEGNTPVSDPGWPAGAVAIFNTKARVAWWEGPPYGGGQWHAECRGDVAELNRLLELFGKVPVKSRKVIVHDGSGSSFWLGTGRDPKKPVDARIDWLFMVWRPESWKRLRSLPADLNPTDAGDTEAPAHFEVYTDRIRWEDVKVPPGIEVVDQRLVSHGYQPTDGVVLEGTVTDLETGKARPAAIRVERVEPQKSGGYRYTTLLSTRTGADGRWVLRSVPSGWLRVVADAEGYVPRVLKYVQFDSQPRWHRVDGELAKSAKIAGKVVDEAGRPLAAAQVHARNVAPGRTGRYETAGDFSATTDAQGSFEIARVPAGNLTLSVWKSGYCRPGLGMDVVSPSDDVALRMIQAAQVRVTVDFGGKARPEGYLVRMSPEGGDKVGSYGGSGNTDAKNQVSFTDVPPGRYVITGQPNPGGPAEATEPVTVELQGGKTAEIAIKSR